MYKHILLTLDGSPLSEQALPHAEMLVTALGARLTLLSCVEPYVITLPTAPTHVPVYNIDTDLEALTEEREEYLDILREELAERGVNVSIVTRQGRPADEIQRFTDQEGVDMIVMSTHGRSGISRFIYGSVAERVLHGAKIPVLLVRVQSPE
ncbi:MAG: universal stress protein [Armatimonadota bacterium]|nr:universal stress protein [Armatimonadota bacterium]